MDENKTLINNLHPYFRMLVNINKSLTKIIHTNTNNDIYENEELFYIITTELLRLMPYKLEQNTDEIVLDNKSGILLLSNKISFIVEKYTKILNFDIFQPILKRVIKIRNKYIHEPHNISCGYTIGGTSMCSIGFEYKGKWIAISTISLAPIVHYLNKIFIDIMDEVKKTIDENEEYKEYPYYKYIHELYCDIKKYSYVILPKYNILGF